MTTIIVAVVLLVVVCPTIIWYFFNTYGAKEGQYIYSFDKTGRLRGVEIGPATKFKLFGKPERWLGQAEVRVRLIYLDKEKREVILTIVTDLVCDDPYPIVRAQGADWKKHLLTTVLYQRHLARSLQSEALRSIDDGWLGKLADSALAEYNSSVPHGTQLGKLHLKLNTTTWASATSTAEQGAIVSRMDNKRDQVIGVS